MSSAARAPRYTVEVLEEKRTAVVVYAKKTKLTDILVQLLSPLYRVYEITYHESLHPPRTDLAVFINITIKDRSILERSRMQIFILLFSKKIFDSYVAWCKNNLTHYKLVHIGVTSRPLRELLSFILFNTPTPYVFDYAQKEGPRLQLNTPGVLSRITLKGLFTWFALSLFALNLTFFLLFGYYLYALIRFANVLDQPSDVMRRNVRQLEVLTDTVTAFSIVPRNTLFWLPGHGYVLSALDAGNALVRLTSDGLEYADRYGSALKLLVKKDKTSQEETELTLRLDSAGRDTDKLLESVDKAITSIKRVDTVFFRDKQKQLLQKLLQIREDGSTLRTLQPHAAQFMGKNGKTKYAVLFMNNMELRPGGGFIGSVGVVEFDHLTLTSLRVYDVYSIDGQLKIHIDPPDPIRNYLGQPHWFLRDSNFSPDFSQNSDYALRFFKRSVGWEEFDGVIGVTFSGVQSFLDAFPNLTMPDYKETVTSDNFFIKAQSYAQNDFFSGSHNKRDFLQAVTGALQVRIQEGDYDKVKFAGELKRALDEKRIVAWFADEKLQRVVEENFWSGQLTTPQCTTTVTCIADYLMVVDANLGVNKANFFVQRGIQLTTKIVNKRLNNMLHIMYKNESPPSLAPGGDYKNYLQVYVPSGVEVLKVTVDGTGVSYTQRVEGAFRVIGVWFTVPVGGQRSVSLTYAINRTLEDNPTYQLIVQKQIGSINNDFIYEFIPSEGYSVSYTNFPNLVTQGRFVYNTFLEKDRLLLIRLKSHEP